MVAGNNPSLQNSPESQADQGVSIVIPAFNEEKAIGPILNALRETMAASGLDHEILVIDDGSTDNTGDIAGAIGAPVKVVSHDVNRGYGAALKTGIRAARFPFICITDADGTYPNERIPELIAHQSGAECAMVVGSRTGTNVAIPFVRKPAKWAIGKLASYIVGGRIPDINSGLRVFRKDLALRIFPLLPDGFSFTTTITLAMWTNGFKVDYLPIDYHARIGRSKIRPLYDTLNFVQLILKMGLYFAPMKIFLPLSGIILLSGISWAAYTHFVLGRLADVSTLVIVMTAVQVGALGLIAELINLRSPRI